MENDLNPMDFWRQVKKCYPIKDKKTVSKTFTIANKPVSEKKIIANAFCSYFTHVTSLINPSQPNFVDSVGLQADSMNDLRLK
jgi:hypothetical protein